MSESTMSSGSRREVIEYAIWATGVVVVVAATAILGSAISAPLFRRRADEWMDAGQTSELSDSPQRLTVAYEHRQGWHRESREDVIYAYRNEDGELVVLSAICTHLGCRVRWEDDGGRFHCPCHGGVYDKAGAVVSGPPSQPLQRVPVKNENNRLLIRRTWTL